MNYCWTTIRFYDILLWKKQTDLFCPDYTVKERAYKFIFKGDRYDVSADMGTGYARIRDKVLSSWVTIDGTPSQNREETNFKIKKREEM